MKACVNDAEKFFFSKSKVPKEQVEFEDGFDEYTPTFEEVLNFIMIRVAGRFTKEELPYFCQELNRNPTYDINEGKDRKFATMSTIRAQLASWKKQYVQGSTPLTKQAIDNLKDTLDNMGLTRTNDLEETLAKTPTPTGPEVCYLLQAYDQASDHEDSTDDEVIFNAVPYETGSKRYLPHIVGVVAPSNKMSLLDVVAVMIDTGATVSLINYRAFPNLGLTDNMLDRSLRPRVATAAKGVIRSEGYINSRLYMKDIHDKFPYVRVNFLVIDSASMPSVVFGHGELVDGQFNLGFSNLSNDEGQEQIGYALHISAYQDGAKRPSRKIIPVVQPNNIRLKNTSIIKPTRDGQCAAKFVSSASQPLTDNSKFRLTAANAAISFGDEEMSLSPPKKKIRTGEHGLETVEFEYLIPVTNCEDTFMPGEVEVFMTDVSDKAPISLSDMDLYDLDKAMNREGVSWEENEGFIMDRISQCPEYFKAPENDLLLPDLDHLPSEYQEKFDQLFRGNAKLLSQHQFDIGTCTLPPVHIPTTPGITSQDKPRHYKPGEQKILREYLKDLLDAGIVKKVETESDWNHNINLVPKSVDGSQKLDRSGHGMTRQQQLEEFGARFCSDLRGVNKALPHEKMTQLPQFNVMCPMLAAKRICTFDIRSGYFSVLLDEAAQQIFGFQVDNEYYVYTRLVQGFKNSVAIFQNLMSKVFSEEAWDRYRKYIPCLEKLNYRDTFSIYVDDLVVAAYDLEQLYYCTEFALMCVHKAGLKFHPKKISIDKEQAEILGFEVSAKRSKYKIATKRAQAILSWPFPSTRDAFISRIASLQYFQQCLPGIKYIVFGLTLLAKSKHDKLYIKKLHKLEFMAMRLLVAMQIEMYIPQLDKPLYVSSDASFSSYAGVVMQKRFLLDENGNETKEEGMVVCGTMSKNFKQHDLQRAIYQKEAQALVQTLRNFEYWIRAAKCTVFSTDCIYLAHIANLKQQDSKMFSTSLFLSTFGNVYYVHSRGSHFLVALADLLSRGLGGSEILSAAGIPKDFLESMAQKFGDPGRMVISPKTLHNVMTAPCPKYTNIPYRKEQRPCPDMIEFSEDQIFNKPTCEAEVLTAMFGGYDAIKPDTIAFQNPDTKRKMSRTEFAQVEKKYKLQNIRQFVEQAAQHQKCDEVAEEKLLQINIYEQDRDFSDQMVKQLKDYLQEIQRDSEDDALLSLCYQYLAQQDCSYSVLQDLVQNFQLSRHYAEPESKLQATRYITGKQASDAEVDLEPVEAGIGLVLKQEVTLDPREIRKLKVKARLATKFEVEFIEKTPRVAVTLGQTEGSVFTWLSILTLFAGGEKVVHLPAGTLLGILKFHGDGAKCRCSKSLEKGLLLDIVPDKELGQNTPAQDALENRMMLFNCMMSVTGEILDKPMAQTMLEDNLGSVMYPVAQDRVELKTPNRRELNQILLLSNLVTNGKVLSKTIIRQWQQSCSFLTNRKLELKRGKDNGFCEIDGILYKKHKILGEDTLLLCLDGVTYSFLLMSMHQQNYHFNEKAFQAYLGAQFFTVNSKAAIRLARQRCHACYFNRKCLRKKSVVPNNFKPAIGARWSSDLVENLERDKNGYKYLCLLVENRTTFCLTIPLKTTKSSEFAAKLEPYLPAMMCTELVTDFGTLYRGPELKRLLDQHHIVHSKSVPQRPQQNGLAEVTAKEIRDFFRTFLLGMPAGAKGAWSEHLYYATTVYNCGIIYAGAQNLTRYNLFHNAERSVNSRFLSSLNGLADQNIRLQKEAMAIIDGIREKAREGYDDSGLRHFDVGQLVMLISNKGEMQKAGNAAGLEPNAGKLHRVLEVTDSGLGVKCENLMTGAVQTFENNKVAPVDSDMLIAGFGFDPARAGSFERALFKRGRGNVLLEALKNSEEDLLPPEFRRDETTSDQDLADENLDELNDNEDSDKEDDTEVTSEQDVVDLHPDVMSEPKIHPYNLRPRVEKVHHIKPKKRVTFSDVEMSVVHDSVAYEGPRADTCRLETLPAFRRDVVQPNFFYAIDQPVRWTSHGVECC